MTSTGYAGRAHKLTSHMKPAGLRGSELAFLASIIALYLAVGVIYLVLPIIDEFGRVLLGSALLPGDVFLTSGILEWGFRTLFSSSHRFFDWNAGFPVQHSLAVTENLIGWQVLYYPLRSIGVGVPAAYNIVLLASLVAAGVGAALLARRLGANRWGAAAAGLIFAFGPFHLNNLMHIQTMAVCWVPYAILFLDRYIETPHSADAIGLWASVVITTFSSIYFGVFLALMLPLYTLVAWLSRRHKLNSRVLERLALLAIIAALTVSPIAFPYARFIVAHGRYREPASNIVTLSMEWVAPLRTPSFQVAWVGSPLRWANRWDGQPAFIGVIGLGLLIVGVMEYRRGNPARAVVLTLVSLSFISYVLALGPYFKTGGKGPSRIVEWVPMPGRLWLVTPAIRWPSRIFFFAWLGAAILAGLGLSGIHRRIQSRWRDVLAGCAILLLVLEYWPATWLAGDSARASSPLMMSDAYPLLARESDRGGVIEFPTSDQPGTRQDFVERYIYGGSGHLRPVVALHGSRIPPVIDSLRWAGDRLPQESGRIFLSGHGVTRVVVHRFLGDREKNARLIASLLAAGYPLLFTGNESAVFALTRSP